MPTRPQQPFTPGIASHRSPSTFGVMGGSRVAVIGGGPAGLMAASVLSQNGVWVGLYEAMPSVARKFLMAGKGGMNISHSEPFEKFVSRYGRHRTDLEPMLEAFTPRMVRAWVESLGGGTFVGSSGRIFPTDMKAAPLLRSWLRHLKASGVNFHVRHLWTGWSDDGLTLRFQTPSGECSVRADAVVLALGGGSWARLGSTGAWTPLLRERGVAVEVLKPSNCGFDVVWSDYFRGRFAGHPLKNVGVCFRNSQGNQVCQLGELMVTANGVEGGAIYSLSALLRDELEKTGGAVIAIDLAPDKTVSSLASRLQQRGKASLANHLRKRVGIDGVKMALLREVLLPADCADPVKLAEAIKALPVRLLATRPIDEAISSAGGVMFSELNAQLMLKALPGVFCAGEMLDWEAPTGGYLLTACLATGRTAGLGALAWL
jgi:uncharacterized flavoprotein (TIGR03862 family)